MLTPRRLAPVATSSACRRNVRSGRAICASSHHAASAAPPSVAPASCASGAPATPAAQAAPTIAGVSATIGRWMRARTDIVCSSEHARSSPVRTISPL
ncbi:hypothetical protein Y049_4718 [Burkholderia pseudomallei MSHR684]|nr:hypothetical protein Y049_4718 [Burkholderia pseudomallei MSHR684]